MAGYETATTVTLMNGDVVSIEAYNLALTLERRGVTMREDAGSLVFGPRRAMTAGEQAAVGKLKRDLLRIVRYCGRAM